MPTPFEYSPDLIIPSWGSHIFKGFGTDSRVVARRMANVSKTVVGGDGIPTVTLNPDKTGQISMILIQGSKSNQECMRVLRQQETTKRIVFRPFSIEDLLGSVIIQAPNAWLETVPDQDFGADAKERTWVWMVDELIITPGQSSF